MRNVRRWLSLSAIGFLPLLFFLVGGLALGDQPAATESVESTRQYITSHWNEIHFHHTFIALAYVAALWFVVVLSRLLRDAEGGNGTLSVLAMVGAAGAIAIELVVVAVHSATFVEGSNTVQLRTMLTAIVRELVVLELLPWATFFAAVAAVSLRHRALPGWLGWSAVALALVDLSVAVYSGLAGVNAATSSGPFAPALTMVYLPTVWFAAAAGVLVVRNLRGRVPTSA